MKGQAQILSPPCFLTISVVFPRPVATVWDSHNVGYVVSSALIKTRTELISFACIWQWKTFRTYICYAKHHSTWTDSFIYFFKRQWFLKLTTYVWISWFDWTRFLDQNLTNPAKNISRSFQLNIRTKTVIISLLKNAGLFEIWTNQQLHF